MRLKTLQLITRQLRFLKIKLLKVVNSRHSPKIIKNVKEHENFHKKIYKFHKRLLDAHNILLRIKNGTFMTVAHSTLTFPKNRSCDTICKMSNKKKFSNK